MLEREKEREMSDGVWWVDGGEVYKMRREGGAYKKWYALQEGMIGWTLFIFGWIFSPKSC